MRRCVTALFLVSLLVGCTVPAPTDNNSADSGLGDTASSGDSSSTDRPGTHSTDAGTSSDEPTAGDGNSSVDGDTSDNEDSTTSEPPTEAPCDFAELQEVATVLATADAACVAWIASAHGRVARTSNASAVVWSTATAATTGVVLGARHSLGMGWSPGDDVAAELTDPNLVDGVIDVQLVDADGAPQQPVAPRFSIHVPALPAAESGSLSDIRPRHDFYVAAIDDQLFTEFKPFPVADALHHAPPTLFDPAGSATASPSYAGATPGAAVLVLGHPAGSTGMAGSVGTVLDDAQAQAALASLAGAGDPEGAVPYDAEAEMFVSAAAVLGMSGGGVFDVDGRLVGIAVRATLDRAPVRYVRAVRTTFIAEQIAAALDAAPANVAAAVAPHLPTR